MPGVSIPLTLFMEDGAEHNVVVDQRDVAAFEMEHRISFTRVHTECLAAFMRWAGWHAARRTAKIDATMKFKDFSEKLIYATDEQNDEEEERKPEVDPTNPAQSGES